MVLGHPGDPPDPALPVVHSIARVCSYVELFLKTIYSFVLAVVTINDKQPTRTNIAVPYTNLKFHNPEDYVHHLKVKV